MQLIWTAIESTNFMNNDIAPSHIIEFSSPSFFVLCPTLIIPGDPRGVVTHKFQLLLNYVYIIVLSVRSDV